MENSSDSYHISFFKPTTDRARANRNMVLWLVTVWFTAIFGFHIVLRIIEEPVPEPSYTAFENAWTNVSSNQFSHSDLQELAKSCLSVSGKMALAPEEQAVIDQAFSWSLYHLLENPEREQTLREISEFDAIAASISDIADPEYVQLKNALSRKLSPVLGLDDTDVRTKLVPFSLNPEGMDTLGEETKSILPDVMSKYLIHNRSVLTDFRFLGFPFHYFYTAVFLLVLFVGLCLIYCLRTDAQNRKLNLAD